MAGNALSHPPLWLVKAGDASNDGAYDDDDVLVLVLDILLTYYAKRFGLETCTSLY